MITIAWKIGYMGEVEYEVHGDGAPYRVSLRFEACEYFRSIYNGGDDQWHREVINSIGVVHRGSEMVKPEVLAAFREQERWRSDCLAITTGYFNHDPAVRTWVRMAEGYQYVANAGKSSFDKHYRCYMHPTKGFCCDPIAAGTCEHAAIVAA